MTDKRLYRSLCRPESVTCLRCEKVFHLTCLDPPLPAKPKAGYAWSCAPCTRAHEEELEDSLNGKGKAAGKAGVAPPMRKAAEGARSITMAQYNVVKDSASTSENGSISGAGAGSAGVKGKGKAKQGAFAVIPRLLFSHSSSADTRLLSLFVSSNARPRRSSRLENNEWLAFPIFRLALLPYFVLYSPQALIHFAC